MNWKSIRYPMQQTAVEQTLAQLEVMLPEEYIRFIGPVNGGALSNGSVSHPELGELPYSRNVSLHADSPANIFKLFPALNSTTKRYFPFGGTGFGDYFCFDLTDNTVVLWLHEQETVHPVCQSFREFLQMLHES